MSESREVKVRSQVVISKATTEADAAAILLLWLLTVRARHAEFDAVCLTSPCFAQDVGCSKAIREDLPCSRWICTDSDSIAPRTATSSFRSSGARRWESQSVYDRSAQPTVAPPRLNIYRDLWPAILGCLGVGYVVFYGLEVCKNHSEVRRCKLNACT